MTDSPPDYSNSDQDAIAEQAMTWFVRLRSSSVTPAERMEFNVWYLADAAHRLAYDETEAFWNDEGFGRALGVADLSAGIAVSVAPGCRLRSGIYVKPLLAAAAAIVLAVMVYRPIFSCWQADYCTSVGEVKTVQLVDGSRVTLNSASAISVNLRNGLRQVRLEQGMAFFDVQRDTLHPFLVDARYSNTKVLGTQFVVRKDRSSDSVTVVGGLVEVSRGRQSPAILSTNDSITVDAERSGEVRKVTSNSATAWMKGSASFDNATLSEVIEELSRYRRGSVLIKDDALKELKVSGRFDITDTDKALEALQETLPIRVYKITPWLVVIG